MTISTASALPNDNAVAAAMKNILVALDASFHADRALTEAIRLVAAEGRIVGIHAYAARLHDRRFRQMEGGLPERYRNEKEMDYQREVHDSLITRGLNIISDSYHDVAEARCTEAGRIYRRLSPEGKNYRRIVEALREDNFDLLAMGAVGLGATPGATVGTVCERVVRRSPTDVLVIRNPATAIGDGPVVVCIDGSTKSYGVLLTAFGFAKRLRARLHIVAAYDPFYHYVAFNRIAACLSTEAGKVFRFKEQEQLHHELIDQGIARIYQSHLNVAKDTAARHGVEVVTRLLEGKPFHAINAYLHEVEASLVMAGKTGVHADDGLDIGGCAENLLRAAPCHVWLGQSEFEPDAEVLAAETVTWSEEAEERLARAPEFARAMARKAVVRHARESGHTFITSDMVDTVAARLMPGRGAPTPQPVAPPLDGEAQTLISAFSDHMIAISVRRRAEKAAIRENAPLVTGAHVRRFVDHDHAARAAEKAKITWGAAAFARLAQVPGAMREHVQARVEALARSRGMDEVTRELCEEAFAHARDAMHAAMADGGHKAEKA